MSRYPFQRRDFLRVGAAGVAGSTAFRHISSVEASDPTVIENWHDLNNIRNDLAGDYILANDLNEKTDGYNEHVGGRDGGWEPIGDRDNSFTGTFDGNGYTIKGLTVKTDRDGGLFGQTHIIEIGNVRLEDVNIVADDLAGGLIGRAGRWFGDSGKIFQVQVTGHVESKTDRAGGIVGRTRQVGNVTDRNSFVGEVVGADETGGIVGRSSDATNISGCYVRGKVESKNGPAGGIVGSSSTQDSEFWQMYSSATVVSGINEAGGIVGSVESDDRFFDSVYYNKGLTEDAVGTGSPAQEDWIPLLTENMQGAIVTNTMANLDFEDLWQTVVDPDGYPAFQIEDPVVDPDTGSITGTVYDQSKNPINGVKCYLVDPKQESHGYDLIEQYPDLFPPDPAEQLSVVGEATTNSSGVFEINNIISDQYYLLLLPPISTDFNPKLRSEVIVPVDKSVTVNIGLAEGRSLEPLNDEINAVLNESKSRIDETNNIAAEVFLDGATELGQALLTEAFELTDIGLGNALAGDKDDIAQAIEPYLADADEIEEEADKGVKKALSTLLSDLDDEKGELLERLVALIEWLSGENGGREANWFTEFKYTSQDELIEKGYTKTPFYNNAIDTINTTKGKYLSELLSQQPDEDFSLRVAAEKLTALRNQMKAPNNFGPPGVVITPESTHHKIDNAETFKAAYTDTGRKRNALGNAKLTALMVKATGAGLMMTKVGAPLGGYMMKFGSAAYKSAKIMQTSLAVQQALEWVFTQIMWGRDLGQIQGINERTYDWLESAVNTGTVAGNVSVDIDLNLNEPEDDGKLPFIVADQPPPEETIFNLPPTYAVEQATIKLTNEGSEPVNVRTTIYTTSGLFSTNSTEGMMVPSAGSGKNSLEIPPNETRTIKADYVADLGMLPVQINQFMLTVWEEGIPRQIDPISFQTRIPEEGEDDSGLLFSQERNTTMLSTNNSNLSDLTETMTVEVDPLIEDELTPESDDRILNHTHSENTHRVRYQLTTSGFAALQIINKENQLAGYDPTRDTIVTEIPGSTASGPSSTPQVVDIPSHPGESFTIRVVAYRFLTNTPSSISVKAIETPKRDPILVASTHTTQPLVAPQKESTLQITITESGQQQDLHNVVLDPCTFQDSNGNALDVNIASTDNEMTIPAGEEVKTSLVFDAPADLTVPGAPTDTRFNGTVSVNPENAAPVQLDLSALVLATSVRDAQLRNADRSIKGVKLERISVTEIPDTPSHIEPLAAYKLTAGGSGNVEIELPKNSSRSPIIGFEVVNGELHRLETGWGSDTVRVAIQIPDDTDPVSVGPIVIALDDAEDQRVKDYANREGIVKLNGLREAISDWRTEAISRELLEAVVSAWKTQEKVE